MLWTDYYCVLCILYRMFYIVSYAYTVVSAFIVYTATLAKWLSSSAVYWARFCVRVMIYAVRTISKQTFLWFSLSPRPQRLGKPRRSISFFVLHNTAVICKRRAFMSHDIGYCTRRWNKDDRLHCLCRWQTIHKIGDFCRLVFSAEAETSWFSTTKNRRTFMRYVVITNAVVTCEIKLFQNYFGLRRSLSEIILF